MNIVYLITFFILGILIGSFLCVVGMRLPKKQNFINGRSMCDTCHKELKFYELIPLFSYIFQKGRCRNCKSKIPEIIPICEILGGLLFATSYYIFGFSYNLIIAILISSLFIIILVSDVLYLIIPDEVLVFYGVCFIIIIFLSGGANLLIKSLINAIILFVIMYLIMIFGEKIFKKESLGGGDVKLMFLVGLILNPILGLLVIFLASLIALPISIVMLYKEKNSMIAFGPFLVLSFMLIYFSQISINSLTNYIL